MDEGLTRNSYEIMDSLLVIFFQAVIFRRYVPAYVCVCIYISMKYLKSHVDYYNE